VPVTAPAVETLLQELRLARAESDRLFSIIKPEAVYDRPIDARHRVIFYVGHLDGFDSIQICREGLGIKSFDPALDELFQAGIDPDSSHLPTDKASDWPSYSRVRAYLQRCREHVEKHLEHAAPDVINMALEHRLMHLETLAYMFHNFNPELKVGPAPRLSDSNRGVSNTWCDIPAGDALLGKPHDGSFGWDNEFDQHTVQVPAFRVQRYAVTNGEYLEFVRKNGAPLPPFWSHHDRAFYLRCMFGEVPLPLHWPVYVTNQQAEAYARSFGKRLMTEAEYHRAAEGVPEEPHGNVNFRSWEPEPVDASPSGASVHGVEQLAANGWEWTATPFAPFPGFRPHDAYPGYSANFFDGEHFVLKGGSSRTAARLLRSSFRNWFRRDYPYMYAKFRCVES
jgi:gamma-glutamyl hercynylcysteine S-oxide synthase